MNLLEKFRNFFTPEKVKELEERLKKVEEKENTPVEVVVQEPIVEKLIKKSFYNVGTGGLTLVLSTGEDLSGTVSEEVYERIKLCTDRDGIMNLLRPQTVKPKEPEEVEEEKEEIVSNLLDILKDNDDFEIVNNELYLKGVKGIKIPTDIVAEFIRLTENQDKEQYEALLVFTAKLLLNPLESSRNQILTFIKKNDVRITKNGNLVLYRRCWKDKESGVFTDFISKKHTKVKLWKKSPKNYYVGKNKETYQIFNTSKGVIPGWENLGNLDDLYKKLPELQKEKRVYYSDHGGLKMVLGSVYKIEEKNVNLNADVCAAGGLHAAAYNYNYKGFGDTPLVVLVNPSKTITVPTYDFGKMRVSEMFLVGVHENEGNHISNDLVHSFDEDYHNYTLEELKTSLEEKSLSSVSISEAVSELSLKEVKSVAEILKNRVVKV